MLNNIGLMNYRAFKTLAGLRLKPITVLAGANSSGKSAIIQALLLLKQSLESRRNRPFVLNGEFLDFSRYSDIVFAKQEDGIVGVTLGLSTPELPNTWDKDFLSKYFSPAETATLLGGKHPDKLRVSYGFTIRQATDSREGNTIQSMELTAVFEGRESTRAEIKVERDGGVYRGFVTIPDPQGLPPQHTIQGIKWDHFLPGEISYQEETFARRRATGRSVPLELFAVDELRKELSTRLHYIGPFRNEPQRAYFMSGDRTDEGSRGEYIAQILLREANEPVSCFADGRVQEMGLLEAVNFTLRNMGLPQSIVPISQEGIVAQLNVPLIGDDRHSVTIADVGYGFSQLLPFIVTGLRAPAGDLIVIEQPETHLHPRVQEALADFIISLYHLGKRVIVETHSDHLINGLRARIAEDPDDLLQDVIQVAFVHAPISSDKGSSIELLKFDPYGMIENWPPDFMSDSMKQMQRILRSGVEKHKKKRGK